MGEPETPPRTPPRTPPARRLRATYSPARDLGRSWREPGGPWDVGPLGRLTPTGAHLAVVDGDLRLTGDDVERIAADLAARMWASGIRRHDVVAWQLPNCASALLLFWACWRIGAVAAPLHRRMGSAEVAGALGQVDANVVVAADELPASGLPGARVITGPVSPDKVLASFAGASSTRAPAGQPPAGGPPAPRAGAPLSSDIGVVLFTSGSSGVPKAVLHSHRGLVYKATLMARVHGLERGDAVLAPAPLAHVSGLLNGVLICAAVAGPCVLLDPWDPAAGLRLLERERIAFMGAPPIFFSQMAGLTGFSQDRVKSLRLISTGGASVSPAFVESTVESYGCRVKRTYGSTEAPTITTSGPTDPYERARDTDGHPVGAAEMSVRDPATSAHLAPGEVGELWIRGPEMFAGYADAGLTEPAIAQPGGWYRSGDLGSVDDEGWLRVTGRLSDTIIRAGENISASEVEAVLEAHPSVRNAVAVPVSDPQVGERVAAVVVTTGPFDLETCREWFALRGITRFKTPELVIAIDSMPTLAAGKPDRAGLRKMAERVARGVEA